MKKVVLMVMLACFFFSGCGTTRKNEEPIWEETTPYIEEIISAVPISGSCGSEAMYDLSAEGVLTISGKGFAGAFRYDYSGSEPVVDSPWFEQKDSIKKVIVKEGITSISAHSFYKCKNLKEVVLPEGIYELNTCTFAYCENLEKINIPASCRRIERLAFEGCASLKEIKLPQDMEDYGIGQGCFEYCHSLESIVIPEGVKWIGPSAFNRCYDIKTVTLPSTIEEIDDYAFGFCTSLEEVILPEGVKTIGDSSFSDCSKLKKIYIPESVYEIHEETFEDSENVIIYGKEGSYAHMFAVSRAIEFVAE